MKNGPKFDLNGNEIKERSPKMIEINFTDYDTVLESLFDAAKYEGTVNSEKILAVLEKHGYKADVNVGMDIANNKDEEKYARYIIGQVMSHLQKKTYMPAHFFRPHVDLYRKNFDKVESQDFGDFLVK